MLPFSSQKAPPLMPPEGFRFSERLKRLLLPTPNNACSKPACQSATGGCATKEETVTPLAIQPLPVTGVSSPKPLPRLALVGNPNVGKSVVFQALTGQYVNVSNFPGTTVSLTQGVLPTGQTLIDTPGVYGLSGLSEEEQVAESSLLQADVVINVVCATTLQRDLFLTQQLLDWGYPLLVAVNQMDELEATGKQLNLVLLEERLGVPVVPCIAVEKNGMQAVLERLEQARPGNKTPDWPENHRQARALEQEAGARLKLYGLRRQYVNQCLQGVLHVPSAYTGKGSWRQQASKQLGQWLLHPLFGALALLAVLLSLYQLIGVWVAGDLVNLLEGELLLKHVIPVIQQFFSGFLAPSSFMYTLLAGEFGLVTMSIQYIIGVLFPLVLGFYLYLSVLEDCGYLPRLAVLADALLCRLGLNGRAIIPIILGLGCVTMATISTRVLTSQRERTIANVLLGITIPCSAQLGVIMGLAAVAGGFKAWFVFVAILFGLFVGIGTVLNQLLPGRSSSLVMDLPPLRWPRLSNIVTKSWSRTWGFMLEAAPLFVLGAALVSVSQATGLLVWIQKVLGPVTQGWLHLPAQAASAFVMGMVRRDFGLAGFNLLKESLTPVQIVTSLVVITLFVPCIASATVMWKERGWKEGAGVLLLSWLMAFAVGAIVTRCLEWSQFL